MSLINQMLRDLEERRQDKDDPRRVRPVAAPGRRSPMWLMLGVAALLLPLSAGLLWWYLPATTDAAREPPPLLPNTEPRLTVSLDDLPADTPATDPEEAPVSLLALEQVETRDGHRLRLDFDGDSSYRRRSGDAGRLVLEVRAELPDDVSESLPPAVSALTQTGLDDERRQLELVLAEGWEAGPLYLEAAPGGGDRLLLDMRPTPEPAAEPVAARSTAADDNEPTEAVETTETTESQPADAPVTAESDDAGTDEGAMVRERRTRSDEERAAEVWAEAREAMRRGRIATAESALQRVLALHPAHVPAREALADLLVDTGRPDAADRVLAESLEIDALPASELGFFARQRARLWLDQDDPAQGIAALEAVYPERDTAPESAALLAGLHYRQGDYTQAIEHYRHLVRQRPDEGAWWMGMGLALEGKGDFQGAVEAYRQALDGDGLGPSVRDYLQARLRELTD